jgi:hypothetical protein
MVKPPATSGFLSDRVASTPSPFEVVFAFFVGEGVGDEVEWAIETRGALIDHLIALGLKSSNVEALAEEVGEWVGLSSLTASRRRLPPLKWSSPSSSARGWATRWSGPK